MPDSKFWRKKVIVAEIETTYGTDAAPTGADAIKAKNVSFNPMEGTDKDLGHDTPWLGAQPTVPVDLHATLSFEVDLVGSGTAGTPPAFAKLLRACGMAETVVAGTSVTYNPISDAMDAATLSLNVDGIDMAMRGTRGTCDVIANASSEPLLRFTFTSLYTRPTDAAPLAPSYAAWALPKVVSDAHSDFAIAGDARVLRSFTLTLGNEVEPRFLVGHEEIVIVDRAEMIEAQIAAPALADFNPFALAEAQSVVPVTLTHETTAGRIITLSAPAVQIMRPSAPTEAQGIVEWPLSLKPLPQVGNDQFTLTFT